MDFGKISTENYLELSAAWNSFQGSSILELRIWAFKWILGVSPIVCIN